MKLIILCFLISLPVFAQEVKDTPNDDTDQAKPSLPQNSEQEQKQEEEQEFLGPYDREGNYKVQIKKPEDEQNSD
ncbi:hypothetical protein [Peredibacter starrii]|uniref:Uncharacterized protein n=1 Tax=Peredibacter starrii TaxID=28202 RepID=A0AAX4HMC9_9BACT|nr:hypothetical protein [Peredibacter starrii]WPU64089.1 hypothetical protein SOO65_15455 [Peredibacter starrii]